MELIFKHFAKLGETLCERIARLVSSLLDCFSVSTGDIYRSMAKIYNMNFKAAEMYVSRTLSDQNFQLNDLFWRCYVGLVFSFLKEKHCLNIGDLIQINIDYTSLKDDFLILSASLTIAEEKGILLYFSMRLYPKRKGQMDQKKMEQAFFKALKHILPKKYKYNIVADRGFGNNRIIKICKKLGFNYTLRISENLNLIVDGKACNLADFKGKNVSFEAYVPAWKVKVKFHINTVKSKKTYEESTWFIISDVEVQKDVQKIYSKRFKIEKLFQDSKSSGFNLENTKIKKYDRVKRLTFLICLAHTITTFVGFFLSFLKEKNPNHYAGILAYFRLEGKL